jgi:hypothetical protein
MSLKKFMKIALGASCGMFLGTSAVAQQLPKGTVISWIPPKESIDLKDPANPKIKLPSGWRSCDDATGQAGFKQDRFVYGASVTSYIAHLKNKDALFAGNTSHGHGASMGDNDRIVGDIDPGSGKSAADAYHKHSISVSEASHLPPYVIAILLCN